jgi:nitrate/nitrite transporter NarK
MRRVNISIAIIPMASEFGWLADRYGGKLVLGAGVVWYVFWHFLAASTPEKHASIRPSELAHIREGTPPSTEIPKLPWRELLSRAPVWAIIVCHFCNNWGGFGVNHLDIAPRYAGLLMGVSNTAGTIPGIVGVTVSGLILDLTGSWALVFGVAAGVYLVGLVVWLLFATGERIFE